MSENACTWTYDEDDDKWDTACGDAFCFESATPKEHHYNFCPRCGKPMLELIPIPENNDEAPA